MELEIGGRHMDELCVGAEVQLTSANAVEVAPDLFMSIQATIPYDFGDGRGDVNACRLFVRGMPNGKTDWLEQGSSFTVAMMTFQLLNFGLNDSDPVVLMRTQ